MHLVLSRAYGDATLILHTHILRTASSNSNMITRIGSNRIRLGFHSLYDRSGNFNNTK